MKKVCRMALFFLAGITLISCNTKGTAEIGDGVLHLGAMQTESSTGTSLTQGNAGYKYEAAAKEGFHLREDMETCIQMCQDACNEFIYAVRNKREPDFSEYIANSNLLEYMGYKVEYFPHDFSGKECTLEATEFLIVDDCVLLKGIPSVYSGNRTSHYGEVSFILQNTDGKISIAEWYANVPDYLDNRYAKRNNLEYKVIDNLDFWENPEKYESILLELRNQ